MTNEHYLVVSSFVCAILSVSLASLVYLFLRRPFAGTAEAVAKRHLGAILKKLFPLGLYLPALAGFASVSYGSCQRTTYEAIIQSRSYLVQKNQEQVSVILLSLVL